MEVLPRSVRDSVRDRTSFVGGASPLEVIREVISEVREAIREIAPRSWAAPPHSR